MIGALGLTHEQLLLGGFAIATGTAMTLAPSIGKGASRIKDRWGVSRGGRGRAGIQVGAVFVSDQSRLRHTHIVGATGTGKTVLIQKLLFEDMKQGRGALVIDPKGDRSFYDAVRAYCASIGRADDLHFLSATFRDESVGWNPCGLGSPSELQTKFFNSAIYSEPHYAKACEFGLLRAFQELIETKSEGFNLIDLAEVLKGISAKDKDQTLQGLFFDLNNLVYGEWESVLLGAAAKQVSLLDCVTQNKILFVDLPTEGKQVQSARLGRLLTQEIILISGLRKRDPSLLGGKPFSVYIDEFDAFATPSFSSFLNKGRSSEFMIHLAHQTLSDLNIVSKEFTGQILGNCNVRFIFRQDDPDDAERWSRFIGTRRTLKQTYTTTDGSRTGDASNREVQEFVVSPDTIKSLPIGACVFSQKTEGVNRVIRVPFEKLTLPLPTSTSSTAVVNQRGSGESLDRPVKNQTVCPKAKSEDAAGNLRSNSKSKWDAILGGSHADTGERNETKPSA